MTFLLCLGFLVSTFLLGNDKLTIKGSRGTGCFFWPRCVSTGGLSSTLLLGVGNLTIRHT